MARYKIDLGLLESAKSEIQADKDKFRETVAYLNSADSSALSKDIVGPILVSCATLNKGFKLLVDWLNEYINAVQETESKAQNEISQIVEDKFDFGIFYKQSASVSGSSISAGALGVGGIIGGSSVSTSPSSGTSPITPATYDELFNKLKLTQDTKSLEVNVENIENEIRELETLLEKTFDPVEQEKIENKLDKLYKDLKEAKYELEMLMLITSLQSNLRGFNTYEEYKAYITKLKNEIDEMLKTLNSDKYTVVDVLHIMLSDDYDKNKSIYVYTDDTGLHYGLENPLSVNEELKNVKQITFNDIDKQYENNNLFKEYKQLFIENNGINDVSAQQAFSNKINNLYDTYNTEKKEIVNKLLPKVEEYNNHQKIVEYIESKVK